MRTRPPGPLALRAYYTIPELARAANMHRDRMRRLLEAMNAPLVRSGRSVLVPITVVQQKLPDLWKCITTVQNLLNARPAPAEPKSRPAVTSPEKRK